MFEESVSDIPSSIWALINQWLTPPVFFVLLNAMIAIIAFTSTSANKNQNQNEPRIDGSSSTVLSQDPQNLSVYKQTPVSHTHFNPKHSQNLETHEQDLQETQSHYFFQENLQISQSQASNSGSERTHEQDSQETQTHHVLDDFEQAGEEKAGENEPAGSVGEVYSQLRGGHFSRTKSDTEPSSGVVPVKLPTRMRKSASLESAFGHYEEEKIVEARRPATVREKKGNAGAMEGDDDEEVDAKADDFINKFKQQLKLQRLDSILRYKDMIGRGR